MAQIELLDPRWVVLLGAEATRAFFPDAKFEKLRQKPIYHMGRFFFITYSPGYALRSEKVLKETLGDLARLSGWVEWLRGLDAGVRSFGEIDASMVSRAMSAITEQGYVWIDSEVLGEQVLFVRDDKVEVPALLATFTRYTLDELRMLQGLTPQNLFYIHHTKRLFGGKLVHVGAE